MKQQRGSADRARMKQQPGLGGWGAADKAGVQKTGLECSRQGCRQCDEARMQQTGLGCSRQGWVKQRTVL